MNKMKLYIVLAAFLGSGLTLGGYKLLEKDNVQIIHTANDAPKAHFTGLNNTTTMVATDFTVAAEQTLPKVVHIKVTQKMKGQAFSPFGGQQMPEEFQ
ncbi:MAG: hypothetical protein KDD27_23500, partial [Saprospiraceae bacterium]|nr:hypothetical protein [Saprospiraceae bacterium]